MLLLAAPYCARRRYNKAPYYGTCIAVLVGTFNKCERYAIVRPISPMTTCPAPKYGNLIGCDCQSAEFRR